MYPTSTRRGAGGLNAFLRWLKGGSLLDGVFGKTTRRSSRTAGNGGVYWSALWSGIELTERAIADADATAASRLEIGARLGDLRAAAAAGDWHAQRSGKVHECKARTFRSVSARGICKCMFMCMYMAGNIYRLDVSCSRRLPHTHTYNIHTTRTQHTYTQYTRTRAHSHQQAAASQGHLRSRFNLAATRVLRGGVARARGRSELAALSTFGGPSSLAALAAASAVDARDVIVASAARNPKCEGEGEEGIAARERVSALGLDWLATSLGTLRLPCSAAVVADDALVWFFARVLLRGEVYPSPSPTTRPTRPSQDRLRVQVKVRSWHGPTRGARKPARKKVAVELETERREEDGKVEELKETKERKMLSAIFEASEEANRELDWWIVACIVAFVTMFALRCACRLFCMWLWIRQL